MEARNQLIGMFGGKANSKRVPIQGATMLASAEPYISTPQKKKNSRAGNRRRQRKPDGKAIG